MNDPMLTRFDGPAPEQIVSTDLVRRGLPVAPLLVVVGAIGWGAAGAASVAYALALVLVNFLLAGLLLAYAARISVGFIMAAALFGYLVRLALIFLAVWLVKDAAWVELVPLGLTIIIAHLGLLIWETKHVSASLAFPALKPESTHSTPRSNAS